uniref:N-acetylglucosaminylphosphatidylinositol deacetylase n=1 Tax=Tetranychus urticae TaxID=32264 RepID=T1JXE5_TETUR
MKSVAKQLLKPKQLTQWETTLDKETFMEKDASTLLVIAHPDDETMFFGPALINLATVKSSKTFVLCLTSGNYDGLGTIRRLELLEAMKEIGLPVKNVFITDHFIDGMNQHWNLTMIAMVVSEKVTENNVSEVITFDEYGISGHPNHKDTNGFIKIFLSNMNPSVKFMTLESVNIFRKYLSFLEAPISLIDWTLRKFLTETCNQSNAKCQKKVFIGIEPSKYLKLLDSLYRHQSQMVWFRRLYSLFSRYMFINTLIEC